MTRLLVTGSRDFDEVLGARHALRKACIELSNADRGDRPNDVILVHGAAPGLDTLAARIWSRWGMPTEAHPADWFRDCDTNCHHKPYFRDGKRACPAAGPLRNQEMVDLGADLCLAFPRGEARGTRDCMRRAEKAGIEVRVIT